MDDWIDILKNRLENESLPLPENDWAWFEAKFRQRRRRKILAGWSAAGLGIAAAVVLIVMLPARKTDEETSLVSKGPVVAVVDEPIELQETVSERLGAVGERSRTTAQGPEGYLDLPDITLEFFLGRGGCLGQDGGEVHVTIFGEHRIRDRHQ